jgi:hypothetical protein
MLGPRARALDDLAQALTFATRAAGHAILGGDAARPRAQLAALRRARRQLRDDARVTSAQPGSSARNSSVRRGSN